MNLNPNQRDQLLAAQQAITTEGKVVYEYGIEIRELSGYLMVTNSSVIVFGDNSRLAVEQETIAIAASRVIQIHCEPSL